MPSTPCHCSGITRPNLLRTFLNCAGINCFRAHSGSFQPTQEFEGQLSPKDIGPFGQQTIFSRAKSRNAVSLPKNELQSPDAQATKAEDEDAGRLSLSDDVGDAAEGSTEQDEGKEGKGISATVESCIVILTAIAIGGARC